MSIEESAEDRRNRIASLRNKTKSIESVQNGSEDTESKKMKFRNYNPHDISISDNNAKQIQG